MTAAFVDATGAFERHQRVAFQLSGGRDSVACLWFMRRYWSRMRVYHLDTGDEFPETDAIIKWVQRRLANPIVMVKSDVRKYHSEVGLPSDIVPFNNSAYGRLLSDETLPIVSVTDCCGTNRMMPMHQRMLDDSVTLIVRGQRDDEYVTPPMRSGDSDGVVEVLYPIQSWTGADVDAYSKANGLPQAPWYSEGSGHGRDCMHCTAWLGDGRLPYVKKHHPKTYTVVRRRIDLINEAVERQARVTKEAISNE